MAVKFDAGELYTYAQAAFKVAKGYRAAAKIMSDGGFHGCSRRYLEDANEHQGHAERYYGEIKSKMTPEQIKKELGVSL